MADSWYEAVAGDAGILQGDLILDCPLMVWKSDFKLEGDGINEGLDSGYDIVLDNVVVMTQACDLEQGKVDEVVVCSHYSLEEAKVLWLRGQEPGTSDKAWKKFYEKINSGSIWNFALLNRGQVDGLITAHRIVDFHEIATVPLKFLQAIAARGPRLRLRPPYREHLSQSFARYFMRVGLPAAVDPPW